MKTINRQEELRRRREYPYDAMGDFSFLRKQRQGKEIQNNGLNYQKPSTIFKP